jgi:hypothetical protein
MLNIESNAGGGYVCGPIKAQTPKIVSDAINEILDSKDLYFGYLQSVINKSQGKTADQVLQELNTYVNGAEGAFPFILLSSFRQLASLVEISGRDLRNIIYNNIDQSSSIVRCVVDDANFLVGEVNNTISAIKAKSDELFNNWSGM